jgi:hypothetical protein
MPSWRKTKHLFGHLLAKGTQAAKTEKTEEEKEGMSAFVETWHLCA